MKNIKERIKIDWKHHIIELVVVFVGVTSAFLLNDWAQKRNSIELEKQYLSSLLKDLEHDSERMKTIKEFSLKNYEDVFYLNELLSKNYSNKDTLLTLSAQLLNFEYFMPQKITFETMKSSGGMTIVSDFDLRTKIIRLYNFYSGPILFDEMIKKFSDEYTIPYFIKNSDMRNLTEIDLSFFYNRQFSNIVIGYLNIAQQKIKSLERADAECSELIAVVKKTLEN